MKITVEFEPDREGNRRVEESRDFLAFWRDAEGAISFVATGWTIADIEQALSIAKERARPVILQ